MTTTGSIGWQEVCSQMPLIAILRGIEPNDAVQVAAALLEAGFLCLEIPLNSPRPLESIERICARFSARLFVGAGTVLQDSDVLAAERAGAQFVVSPHTRAALIETTKTRGLISVPGFATPTEAFTALEAGADALKLFPAESSSPVVLKAMRAVLPRHVPVFAVGGITPRSMRSYYAAGAAGFGIGSAVYSPGLGAQVVQEHATAFVSSWQSLRKNHDSSMH